MEFSLDFYNYYMVCVLFSHTYHMTHHVTSHCDFLSCDHDTCDTCDITLSHTLSYIVSPKEKKKKRNINNNLAVLPSYDTLCNLATSTRYSVFSLFQVIDHKDPSSSLLLEIGYYDLAKQLSHYLYLLYFTFSFGLTTQEGVQESVMSQVSHSYGHMTESHSVISHDIIWWVTW